MTQPLDFSTSLKTLLERDPDLTGKLQKAIEPDEVKEVVMESAQRYGMALDAAALEQQVAVAARHGEILTRLRPVMLADPSLEQALQQTTKLEAAVDLIRVSAERHGMELDADELLTQLQSLPIEGELSDEELEGVAGGVVFSAMVVLSAAFAVTMMGAAAAGVGAVMVGYVTTKKG